MAIEHIPAPAGCKLVLGFAISPRQGHVDRIAEPRIEFPNQIDQGATLERPRIQGVDIIWSSYY